MKFGGLYHMMVDGFGSDARKSRCKSELQQVRLDKRTQEKGICEDRECLTDIVD